MVLTMLFECGVAARLMVGVSWGRSRHLSPVPNPRREGKGGD
jgi:hypothetical protein